MPTAKVFKATVAEVDAKLGLVFGWGMICTEKGVDHFDTQGDHIPHKVMLESSTDFMQNSRAAKAMHEGDVIGAIVHSFPLTDDVAEKMGISSDKTGWMVAMKPHDQDVMKKFEDGDYTGFSIGGVCSFIPEPEGVA